jgi:hypothetical protein
MTDAASHCSTIPATAQRSLCFTALECFINAIFCTGALRRGAASDLGRGDRHSHARRGRNSNRHNEREIQKSMTDLDDDDNFSMRFQTLDEVVGQVCSCVAFEKKRNVHAFQRS